VNLTKAYVVREYLTSDGRNPYRTWLDNLDIVVKARIQARICGGDKSSQHQDIRKAQLFWTDYMRRRR